MNATNEFWSGRDGDAYLERNRVDWRARIPFWRTVLDLTGARSVYELGANAGWNLSAIRRCYPDVEVTGVDINQRAAGIARQAGLKVKWLDVGSVPMEGDYELAFTAGVLIHVPPDALDVTMRSLISMSTRYVLAVEYSDEQEVEVEYRGQAGLLWRRPYGKLYEAMGLKPVAEWLPEDVRGFDRCHAWLFSKE